MAAPAFAKVNCNPDRTTCSGGSGSGAGGSGYDHGSGGHTVLNLDPGSDPNYPSGTYAGSGGGNDGKGGDGGRCTGTINGGDSICKGNSQFG
jgi:hypothetical protein